MASTGKSSSNLVTMSKMSFTGSLTALRGGSSSPTVGPIAPAVSTDLNVTTAKHALARPLDNLDMAEFDVLIQELERNFDIEKKLFEGAEALAKSLTKKKDKDPVMAKAEESWNMMLAIRARLTQARDMKKAIGRTVLITQFPELPPGAPQPTVQEQLDSINSQIEREKQLLQTTERLLQTYRDKNDEVVQRALESRFQSMVRIRRLTYSKQRYEMELKSGGEVKLKTKEKKKKKASASSSSLDAVPEDGEGEAGRASPAAQRKQRKPKTTEDVTASSSASPPSVKARRASVADTASAIGSVVSATLGKRAPPVQHKFDDSPVSESPPPVSSLSGGLAAAMAARRQPPPVAPRPELSGGEHRRLADSSPWSSMDSVYSGSSRSSSMENVSGRDSVMVVDIESAMNEERLNVIKTAFLLCDEKKGLIHVEDVQIIRRHIGVHAKLTPADYDAAGVDDDMVNMRQYLVLMGHKSEVDLYDQVFKVVDQNGRGAIGVDDLTSIMEMLGISNPRQEALSVIRGTAGGLARKQRDLINFDEFVDAMIRLG